MTSQSVAFTKRLGGLVYLLAIGLGRYPHAYSWYLKTVDERGPSAFRFALLHIFLVLVTVFVAAVGAGLMIVVFRWRNATLSRGYAEKAYYKFSVHMFLCATLLLVGYSSIQWLNIGLFIAAVVWFFVAIFVCFRS